MEEEVAEEEADGEAEPEETPADGGPWGQVLGGPGPAALPLAGGDPLDPLSHLGSLTSRLGWGSALSCPSRSRDLEPLPSGESPCWVQGTVHMCACVCMGVCYVPVCVERAPRAQKPAGHTHVGGRLSCLGGLSAGS